MQGEKAQKKRTKNPLFCSPEGNNIERYFAPETEVLELKLEGVIAASGGDVTPNNPFSGWPEDTWS